MDNGTIKTRVNDVATKVQESEYLTEKLQRVSQWKPAPLDNCPVGLSVRVYRYNNGTYDSVVAIKSPDIARAIHALVVADVTAQLDTANANVQAALYLLTK